MKRITVSVSDDLATWIRAEARRSDVSVSESIRRMLATAFNETAGCAIANLGGSGRKTTARNAERELQRLRFARGR